MKKKIIYFLKAIVLIYIALLAGLYLAQRDMLYVPSAQKLNVSDFAITDISKEEIVTKDGLALSGWFVPPSNKSLPVIIWFHGNASNSAWQSRDAAPFVAKGYGALLVEYRGYGGNPGAPAEASLYDDARSWMKWLKAKGYENDRIILYGQSLGSGVAVQMADENKGLKALILESAFSSIADAAQNQYWFIPVRHLIKDKYDNMSKIKNIQTELIMIHGTNDILAPYAHAKKLFGAGSNPKTFISIEGAGHNDINLPENQAFEKIFSVLSNDTVN